MQRTPPVEFLFKLLAVPVLVVIGILASAMPVDAQTWAQAIGGSGNETANSIRPTADGGYILAGHASAFPGGGLFDAWVVKLSPGGSIEWQREFGGSFSDYARSVRQTADGGYIVAGSYEHNPFNQDFWLIKLDAAGFIQWQWAYGNNGEEVANDVEQTADGGFVIAGYATSFGAGSKDFWVVKTGPAGTFEWQRAYGGLSSDSAYAIAQASDGGYVVAGDTVSFGAGQNDAWVLTLDATGIIVNQWAFGGASNDHARSVEQTADGGFIVAGLTGSFGAGNADAWVLKLSATGEVDWSSAHGGVGDDQLRSVARTADGGYVAAGFRNGNDVLVLKYSASGAIEWQHAFGGGGNDFANDVRQTSDGGFVVGGYTTSFGVGNDDAWVLKLNSGGTLGSACTGVVQDTDSLGSNTPGVATLQCSD